MRRTYRFAPRDGAASSFLDIPANQPQPAYVTQMENAGGYLLSRGIAPVWIGEFGTDTGSLANFGLAPS
jgi:hypothetical protein